MTNTIQSHLAENLVRELSHEKILRLLANMMTDDDGILLDDLQSSPNYELIIILLKYYDSLRRNCEEAREIYKNIFVGIVPC